MHMAYQMLSGSSPCWHPSIHSYGHYHSVICRIHWTVYSLSPLSSQPSPMNISHVSLSRCLDPKFKGSFYSSLSLISPHLFFSVSLIISIFKIGPKPIIFQLCYSFFSQSTHYSLLAGFLQHPLIWLWVLILVLPWSFLFPKACVISKGQERDRRRERERERTNQIVPLCLEKEGKKEVETVQQDQLNSLYI